MSEFLKSKNSEATSKSFPHHEETNEISHMHHETEHDSTDTTKLKRLFFDNLVSVGHEFRYGKSMNHLDDYEWLENHYMKVLSNPTTYRLIESVRSWDLYTYQHSLDVFVLSSLLAKRTGIDHIKDFSTGCLLHDIGKLHIPRDVLKKPARLTFDEYELIKMHTIYGYTTLLYNDYAEDIANLAKYHHERTDGSGYPCGLLGHEMSAQIKLLGMVDVYCALTLDRPYRKAFSLTEAVNILREESIPTDDPLFIEFIKMLDLPNGNE